MPEWYQPGSCMIKGGIVKGERFAFSSAKFAQR
jgi:hypothetical protein